MLADSKAVGRFARVSRHGRLPERPKGAVCKTVGFAYVGSNPTPATRKAPGWEFSLAGGLLLRSATRHRGDIQGGGELLLADLAASHIAQIANGLGDTQIGLYRVLGDLGRGLVADDPVQRGDDRR